MLEKILSIVGTYRHSVEVEIYVNHITIMVKT